MTDITFRTVASNGIDMHIAEAGPADGPLVLLCHGFPESWYSWRHQLPALAEAGYHAVAPDQRGYGRTSAPEDDTASPSSISSETSWASSPLSARRTP